jgi:hypothetical protein
MTKMVVFIVNSNIGGNIDGGDLLKRNYDGNIYSLLWLGLKHFRRIKILNVSGCNSFFKHIV